MPKKNIYDAHSMESAVNDVKINKLSLRAAAKKYGVPKSTLDFKLKNPGHKDTCGPSPILSVREESELVLWIEELANRGFPRKKDDILNSVQKFLIENPRPNPFKNHRPGECWFKAFLRRHPTIVQRTSEAVSSASACVSEADIRKWFSEIRGYLETKNINIDDPSRIYNGDETGFQICPSTGKVFASKGAKNVYAIDKGSQKENITVMFSFSASGMTCPPMIIYPYKRIPEKIAVTVNSTWGIGRSDNGWMTADTFYDYIKNIFYPHLVEKHVEFPVMLFLDGHKSHLTYELSLLCNELNIEVIALYPNATRILQPCDVAVFRPIKVGWKKAVREFYETNPGQILNTVTFAPLLETVVTNVVKPETLQNGFKACGLFPFDPNAVYYSKCLGKVNKPTSEVTHADSITMDNKTFTTFLGDELITKFKSFDAMLIKEGINKEFLALYQMWTYFRKPDNTENIVQIVDNEIMEDQNEWKEPGAELEEPSTELEGSPLGNPTAELFEESNIVLKDPNPLTSTKSDVEVLKIAEDSEKSEDKSDPTIVDANSGKINVLEHFVIKPIDAVKESATCGSNNFEDIKLAQTSQATLVDKNIYNAASLQLPSTSRRCISAFLTVPNKRNVERVSFAITSRSYQENFEAKRALKLEEDNKKLERKRIREEKLAVKSAKAKRVRKSADSVKDGHCFICTKRLYKNSHYFKCDNCQNYIHRQCVPNKHKKHVPDIEDDDLFMCHVCYKEESDEEVASEDSDENEEEKENVLEKDETHIESQETEQNKEEIDELYNMYKNAYAKSCY